MVVRSNNVDIKYGRNVPITSTDPNNYHCMPPICQIDDILQNVRINQGAEIVLDYGSFSLQTIKLFKKFHAGKVVQDQVKKEIAWEGQQCYLTIDAVSQLDQNNLHTYLRIVLDHTENETVSIAGIQYNIDDLIFLYGERWLSNSLMYHICVMLNTEFHLTKTWVSYAPYIQLQPNFCAQICNKFSKIQEGQLILIIPVGCHGGTYFMESLQVINSDGSNRIVYSNHFAMAVYSLDFDVVSYADTLGWGIPDEVKSIFRNVAQQLGKQVPLYNVSHQPGGNVNGGAHICTNLCSLKYPLQTCSSICGVSVIVGASLACLYRTGFYGLASQNSQCHSDDIAYLRNISDYSHFLRRVIMQWIIMGRIDVNMLVQKRVTVLTNVSVNFNKNSSLNLKHTATSMNPCKVSRNRHQGIVEYKSVPLKTLGSTEMPLTLDYVNIAALIIRKPTVLFIKSKFLRLSVMTLSGKIVTKQFPCSQDGKHDIQAIGQIQSFVHSANAVIWLEGYISSVTSKGNKQSISGLVTCSDWSTCLVSARITFELQKYLRLICTLKCGHQKSKYFHCSLSGKKDLNAITEIQNFVDGESFNDWLKYVNYVHIGTVPTGIASRRYLDKILFDKRIRIRQSKNVNLNIKRDEDILFVSNVARQDKKQFHRTDDSFIPIESDDMETFGIKTAVVMNVLCSSHTSVCRNKCGCIIKDMAPSLTECPKCNVSLINYNQCINCETLHTSQWRTVNSQKLCNACYLYNFTHKSHRLESMFSHHMGPPNIHPHMLCGWKLKLIIKWMT